MALSNISLLSPRTLRRGWLVLCVWLESIGKE